MDGELITMYDLAGVKVKRLVNPNSQAPSPFLTGTTTELEKSSALYPAWNGEESRPGQGRFSRTVRQRDRVCQKCGQAKAEEAHHLRPWSKRPTTDSREGIGVCKACHAEIHRSEQGKAVYSENG